MQLELARQQWEDGWRRVETARARDHGRHAELLRHVGLVVDGLRRRVGQTFTLTELVAAYDGADEWARGLIDESDPEAPPVSEPGTVADAAFHSYARGAVDYTP
jgi:hypothetical protein